MKKTYQAPQVKKVIYTSNIMEDTLTPGSIGVDGKVKGEGNEDGDWEFAGDGEHPIHSKGTGRFWDDEY